jgi:hypothetical protein
MAAGLIAPDESDLARAMERWEARLHDRRRAPRVLRLLGPPRLE